MFVVLLLILLANTGLRLVEDVNEGDIPSIFLIELLFLKIIQYSSIIIPLSLFFGIIISLNKFYTSNEMIIIKLNGFSNYKVATILTKLILLVTVVMILLKFIVSPLAVEYRAMIEHKISHEQKIYSLKEGSFNISNDKSKVIYINNKDKSELANIFIRSHSNSSTRIEISSGVTSKESAPDLITLADGISYVFNSDGSFSSTKYTTQDMMLSNKIPKLINSDLEAKSIMTLLEFDTLAASRELFNRFSIILSGLILAYLAIPLSNYSKKNDKYGNIFIGAIFYFGYIIMINILSTAASNKIDLLLSAMILHASFIYLASLLYIKTSRAAT